MKFEKAPTKLDQADVDAALNRLGQIKTLSDLRMEPPKPQRYILEGLLAERSITLLGSKPKTGKTTWLLHFLRALNSGVTTFVGQAIEMSGKVLIVSEEDEQLWMERFADQEDNHKLEFYACPFGGRPTLLQWQEQCHDLGIAMADRGCRLLVIDPIAQLIPGDENSSQAMNDFLMPLRVLARWLDAGILLLHHPTKKDQGGVNSFRGSGALPCFVDILIEMEQIGTGLKRERMRRLKTTGRNAMRLLREFTCELAEDESCYRRLSSEESTMMGSSFGIVLPFLKAKGEAFTAEELRNHVPWPDGRVPSSKSIFNALTDHLGTHVEREGEGVHGSPYRFRAIKCEGSGSATSLQARGV